MAGICSIYFKQIYTRVSEAVYSNTDNILQSLQLRSGATMTESNFQPDDLTAKVDLIAAGFNQVLASQDKAVKEFKVDKKPPDYCHRPDEVLEALDGVLVEHDLQDLYIVSYVTKPRLVSYASHTCVPRINRDGTITMDCSK